MAIYLSSLKDLPQRSTLLHWHEELQLVIDKQGRLDYTVENQQYALNEGDILLINSRCLHMGSQAGAEDAEYICIDFHPGIISGNSNSLISRKYIYPLTESSELHAVLIRVTDPSYTNLKGMIDMVINYYEGRVFAYELKIMSELIKIWLLIIDEHKSILADNISMSPQDQQRIDKILGFIQAHYSEKLTLGDLASELNCSPEECCRLFRRTVSQSPMNYLCSFRILKSLSMLTTTDRSIADIAQDMGFGSSSYYTEKFKSIMKCRPLEYRKRFAKSGSSLRPLPIR